MRRRLQLLTDGASVINTSSISGLQGEPMLSTYGLSKAALDESAMLTGQWLVYDGGFTAGIALQLAPKLGVPA